MRTSNILNILEHAGSSVKGAYGLMTGADHPLSGANSRTSIWSVVSYRIEKARNNLGKQVVEFEK